MPKDDYLDEPIVPSDDQLKRWKGETFGENPLPTMEGPCPQCGHGCEIPVRNRVFRGAAPAGKDDQVPGPEPVTRQFRCNCLEAHDRPEGVTTGCGRWWISRVVQTDGEWTLELETDSSRTRWAVALARSESTAATRVQAAAEKWTAGVTALLGLFSLAGVVTAKDALVGLGDGSKVAIAVAFVVIAALAATSLVLAYTAAYGWPGTDDVSDNEAAERWYERLQAAPLGSAKLLRWAVLLALATVGALLVIVMLLWFLPRETPVVTPTKSIGSVLIRY